MGVHASRRPLAKIVTSKQPLLPLIRSPGFRPRPVRILTNRFLVAAFLLIVLLTYIARSNHQIIYTGTYRDTDTEKQPQQQGSASQPTGHETPFSYDKHPIEELVEKADDDFQSLLSNESKGLAAAAAAYRQRRGRHPPPGFAAWYQYATEQSSLVIEDLFDPIYDDLSPFWGLDPIRMREAASTFEMRLKVRNGKVSTGSNWFWTVAWMDMVKEVEHLLPDMDIALNPMDEPRTVAPWEEVEKARQVERGTRLNFSDPKMDVAGVVQEFERLPDMVVAEEDERKKVGQRLKWTRDGSYWDLTKVGCSPDSSVGQQRQQTNSYMHHGFVSNFTAATSVCGNPRLHNTSGIFTHPLSIKSTTTLFPLFGGSKLETNNEIRLPAPMYFIDAADFSGGDDHGPEWENKADMAIWRGFASGGKAGGDKWIGMQRHRFVYLNNATAEPGPAHLAATKDGEFAEWASEVSDIHFVGLNCGESCELARSYFEIAPKVVLGEQFKSKLLPDIDGNSFSGRYRGFLLSTSLPVKATVWKEWHDSRLVAWKHFVPMSYWYEEWWSIVEYFLGYKSKGGKMVGGNDETAKKIAMDGKEWAEKVLRKEDMIVYTFRLLLEYARVTDPRRGEMGWVEDLVGGKRENNEIIV